MPMSQSFELGHGLFFALSEATHYDHHYDHRHDHHHHHHYFSITNPLHNPTKPIITIPKS
jgi:hypothetical protein